MDGSPQIDPAAARAIGDDEPRVPLGTRLGGGRFEITGEIGRGGMAVVYRGRDRETSADVAIKVANRSSQPGVSLARMRNEARLGASMGHHPNVVRALAHGTVDTPGTWAGRPFLVVEYFDGHSLDQESRASLRGLDERRACIIAREVARALAALHERGIVHRDVKPDNVLIGRGPHEGRTVLIDFGLAFATGDGWEPASPELTSEGLAPGTPLYMSPQQMAHLRPEPSFDVYALGVLMYELLAGGAPLDECVDAEIVARKVDPKWRPYPLDKARPGLPTRLTRLVHRCMAQRPKARPTARQVVAELDDLLIHRRSRVGTWIGLGAAAGLTVAFAVWQVQSRLRTVESNPEAAPQRYAMGATTAEPTATGPSAAPPHPVSPPAAPPSPAASGSSGGSSARPDTPPRPAAPSAPATDRDSCSDVRAEARAKWSRQRFESLLRLTTKRRCWKGHEAERQRLRVRALLETKRYAQCQAEAAETSDRQVARWGAMCTNKSTSP